MSPEIEIFSKGPPPNSVRVADPRFKSANSRRIAVINPKPIVQIEPLLHTLEVHTHLVVDVSCFLFSKSSTLVSVYWL